MTSKARALRRVVLTLVFSISAPIGAQDTGSDRLRSLVKGVPDLRVDRTEIISTPAMTFEGISAVTADKQGNLYVIHRPVNGDPVVVLDARGKILRSWGKGMFTLPHSIRVDPAGNVWTVDAHTSMVYKFTPTGRKLLEISVGGVPDLTQDFCGATDIAFGPNGRIFVSDGYCNGRVIEYDARGRTTREWGRKGSGPGEFDVIHAIVVGPGGYLYAADRENGRVQWFTLDGEFVGQWKFGGQLYSLAFAPSGKLYISTHPKDAPLTSESAVIEIHPVTGRMLGVVHVRAHELGVTPDGKLLPATRSSQLLLFRPRK